MQFWAFWYATLLYLAEKWGSVLHDCSASTASQLMKHFHANWCAFSKPRQNSEHFVVQHLWNWHRWSILESLMYLWCPAFAKLLEFKVIQIVFWKRPKLFEKYHIWRHCALKMVKSGHSAKLRGRKPTETENEKMDRNKSISKGNVLRAKKSWR